MKQREEYKTYDNRFYIIDTELKLSIDEPIGNEMETLFYENGTVKAKIAYNKGELHGPSIYYGQEKQVIAETWFVNGLQQGKASYYYPNGQLAELQRFVNGERHLMQEHFFENGKTKSLIPYSHGKLDGTVLLYSPDGTIERELHYHQGKRV